MRKSIFGRRILLILFAVLIFVPHLRAEGHQLHLFDPDRPEACSKGNHTRQDQSHDLEDPISLREHLAVLALVPRCASTHTARRSGMWSDPGTWKDGVLPASNARVEIPAGVTVTLNEKLATSMDWVRVEGKLLLQPDRDTSLTVRTIVVSPQGSMQIGSSSQPIATAVSATVLFAPRQGRDRAHDPFDLAGGLISLGVVEMRGAQKEPFAIPATILRKGTRTLEFPHVVEGWKAGDELLFPGVDAFNVQDETRRIATVERDGAMIILDEPLSFDHLSPQEPSVPVGNLTRNIALRSLSAAPLFDRAHVMFMHNQTGTEVDGVSFINLGRTDTRSAHTIPSLDSALVLKSGTDENTIGRYPVHFHIVSGARKNVPPHVMRNSVVVNSPKHGVVNHGGHVAAERNITFEVAGSHFFAENGSEIGNFTRNLAVRSAGSGDGIVSRSAIFDNGHGGHGFWLQGAGVEVTENWAFGHAASGFTIFGYAFAERGHRVYFDARNVGSPSYADAEGRVPPSDINLHFARNIAAGSPVGIEIWNHKLLAQHTEMSVVEDCVVWNTISFSVFAPYVRNTIFRNLALFGILERTNYGFGIGLNTQSENLTFENVSIENFGIGMMLPQRGINKIIGAKLRNQINLRIETANRPGRLLSLENIDFDYASASDTNVEMKDLILPENGDYAMFFQSDRILLSQRTGPVQQLFFPSQASDHMPFTKQGPEILKNMTAQEILNRFGLAFGGRLAPTNAQRLAQSNALMAPAIETIAPTATEEAYAASPSQELYPLASKHILHMDDTLIASRWEIVRERSKALEQSLVFVKITEPKLILHPLLKKLEIHPSDVQFGYRLTGLVVDLVGSKVTKMQFINDFFNLAVQPDATIPLDFQIPDPSGKYFPVQLTLRVTDSAVRRGQNLNFFDQKKYCGDCTLIESYAEIKRLFPNAEE